MVFKSSQMERNLSCQMAWQLIACSGLGSRPGQTPESSYWYKPRWSTWMFPKLSSMNHLVSMKAVISILPQKTNKQTNNKKTGSSGEVSSTVCKFENFLSKIVKIVNGSPRWLLARGELWKRNAISYKSKNVAWFWIRKALNDWLN